MSIKGKINDLRLRYLNYKQEHRWLRVLLNKYSVVTVMFLIWMLFLDNNNIGVWMRTRRTLRNQERSIVYLRNQIQETENRLYPLKSVTDSLERFAREEYFFHEDGEDVYIVK